MWFKKNRLYADAAAATPLLPPARAELVRLLDLYGNAGGLHKEAVSAKEELEKARHAVASAIGAHADEIVFTSGGTEANNLALHGAHGHVVTTAFEHPSVLAPLERSGARITRLYEFDDVADALTPETSLVSVQLVNSEVGTINDLREIGKQIRRSRMLRLDGKAWPSGLERRPEGHAAEPVLHTDASQAPLWVDIKVEKLHVDLMTLDGQKIGGPKGVGCLYIRRGTLVEPQLLGGGQEGSLRSGTENVPLIGSFAVAMRDAQAGVEARAKRVGEVRDYLWQEIKKIAPDAVLHGPMWGEVGGGEGGKTWPSGPERTLRPAHRAPNNINFSIPNLDGQMAAIALDAHGVAVGTRSACSTGDDEPSAVLLALGVEPTLARGAVRITLLPDATKKDANTIAHALAEVVKLYKK